MNMNASAFFSSTWPMAIPVLRITGTGGLKWKRDMSDPKDPRVGPWLQATYQVLDERTWQRLGDSLYFVVAQNDGKLRYVGKSKKQVSERWRVSPALCAETGVLLPGKQCMKPMQAEYALSPNAVFEVRTLCAQELRPLAAAAGLSQICRRPLDCDFVEELEKWMCRSWSPEFAGWNKRAPEGKAVTNRRRRRPTGLVSGSLLEACPAPHGAIALAQTLFGAESDDMPTPHCHDEDPESKRCSRLEGPSSRAA
jgi:hypothetical protein